MSNGFNMISKDEFVAITETNAKLNILYGYIHDVCENHHARIDVLEKAKRRDTATSGMLGIVGGFVAVVGKGLWGMIVK